MPEETQDANAEASSSLEGAIASSPEAQEQAEQQVETQAPTAEQGETQPAEQTEVKEPPFHEHPRWKEMQDTNKWLRDQLQRRLEAEQRPQQPPAAQPTDPYAGMDPQSRVFYEDMDKRIEAKAHQIVQQNISPQIDAAKNEFARIRAEQFYSSHPDIKPGTPEDAQIVAKVQMGYNADDAYRAVMWDKMVGQKQVSVTKQQQQRLQAKQRANVVSPTSVSPAASTPPKMTYEEELKHKLNTEWDGQI